MTTVTQTLLDAFAAPSFVLKPDAHGNPVYAMCNAIWFQETGRTPSKTYGRTVADVFEGQFGAIAYPYHVITLSSKQPMKYELTLPINSELRRLETTLTPLCDADGTLTCVIGSSQDKTTSKRAIELDSRYTDIARDIEEFVAFGARDLSVPLRQVSALARQLSEGFVDMGDGKLPLIKRLDEVSRQATDHLAELLERAQDTNLSARIDTLKTTDVTRPSLNI